jgi:hypothetical protein
MLFTPSMCDGGSLCALPLESYPGVTVPFVWNHQRTTRPPAAYVFFKIVWKVARSGFGTSFAKLTHATLRPLAKLQIVGGPASKVDPPELEPEVPELEPPPELDPASTRDPEMDPPPLDEPPLPEAPEEDPPESVSPPELDPVLAGEPELDAAPESPLSASALPASLLPQPLLAMTTPVRPGRKAWRIRMRFTSSLTGEHVRASVSGTAPSHQSHRSVNSAHDSHH